MDIEAVRNVAASVRQQIQRVIVGQDETIELALVALLSGGHVLLEGVPGTAKTLLARTFSRCLSLRFGRIQFTPDLMPGDIIGTNLFNFKTNEFHLTKGPIFTELLLADEINRTPPKTQAALLEAMQERKVTIDGRDHDLGAGFMVVATQNPIEQEGTYPLPEAQLDRFLFKILVPYPDRDQERAVVQAHGNQAAMPTLDDYGLQPLADLGLIAAMREVVSQIRLGDELIDYIVDVVRATREHPALAFGASPRAASMIATAVRALAALGGRSYALPDDVKVVVVPALRHRVVLAPGAEIEGLTTDRIIATILEQVPAPR